MGFNSSPESDDSVRKNTPAEVTDNKSPLMIPDRFEDDWRKSLSTWQKAGEMPLPTLELHNPQEPRSGFSLPPELLALYGGAYNPKDEGQKEKAGQEKEIGRAGDTSPSKVKFDNNGYASDIVYPDGKTRHIERDPQTREATSITTSNSEGTTKLVNQGGRWYMEVQGMHLPFPGKIDVAKSGDIAMQTGADGVWRIEKTDGSTSEEKENADGARISYDSRHRLAKITRKDGTILEQLDENTIVESHPGTRPVSWTNLGGLWSAADGSDRPRKNLALREDGSLSFEDANGIKHTINSSGLETLEGAGLGKIVPDAANRPQEVESADGKRVRKYEYFDDKSREIKSVTIVDKEKNTTTVYTRENKDSKQWRSDKGNYWTGEIQVSQDGVHSVRASNNYRYSDDNEKNQGKWTSYHPDGRETTDSISADGARASYDKQNNLVSFRSPGGMRIDRLQINGQDTVSYYDPKIGQTINWKKNADGNWASDSTRFADSRRDLAFNTNGELSYTNDRGGKVQEHRDGSRQIVEKDGTKLDFDANGEIIKATKGNLERTFIRDANGIALVKDRNSTSKEERSIFERRPAGEENRTNIFVSPNGDLSYQNPDGTAVIERSNMLHLDLDKDGDITRVVGPKSTRTLQYAGEGEHKALVNITDTRKTEKGEKNETWTRVVNPDGSLSSEFRSIDDKGKERKPRYNITPCADGEYEYRLASDKPGDKVHVERLTKEGMDGMPESIEDARQELISVLEGVMDKNRLEQNIQFMKKFEKRMMDQTELQLAAGLDQEKVMRETERSIVDTYYHTARLCAAQGPKELYGQKDRVRLAENLLYLAQDPQDIKQGSQGTCWWESSWNVGLFQRNAGHAARFIADVALTSQYTSTAGPLRGGNPKTIKIPAQYVSLRNRDGGAGWTPQNSKSSSQRSMVGMLIDQIGPPLGGQRGWGQSDAGWHTEARNILFMMTGRDQIRHGSSGLGRHEKLELLKTGGWTASGSGHMWGYSMKKDSDGSWVVLRDDQYAGADRVIQRVKDLRSWISGDIASEVRKNWRPSPLRKGESNDGPLDRSSFANINRSYSPRREDERIAVVQMPRPVWRPSMQKRNG